MVAAVAVGSSRAVGLNVRLIELARLGLVLLAAHTIVQAATDSTPSFRPCRVLDPASLSNAPLFSCTAPHKLHQALPSGLDQHRGLQVTGRPGSLQLRLDSATLPPDFGQEHYGEDMQDHPAVRSILTRPSVEMVVCPNRPNLASQTPLHRIAASDAHTCQLACPPAVG